MICHSEWLCACLYYFLSYFEICFLVVSLMVLLPVFVCFPLQCFIPSPVPTSPISPAVTWSLSTCTLFHNWPGLYIPVPFLFCSQFVCSVSLSYLSASLQALCFGFWLCDFSKCSCKMYNAKLIRTTLLLSLVQCPYAFAPVLSQAN